MDDERGIGSLIRQLRNLYARMAMGTLEARREKLTGTGQQGGEDVARLLSEHLERLAAAKRPDDSPKAPGIDPAASAGGEVGDRSSRNRSALDNERPVGELSNHFHELEVAELTGEGVGEGVKRRVLEHINTALRLARRGDPAGARIHADIARSAMREAVHYLSGEEYRQFTAAVKERLERLET
jgi:hypothetical protein